MVIKKIHIIPLFKDNYCYLIQAKSNIVSVVDPADPMPVRQYLEKERLELDTILITHKHWDHAGNAPKLKEWYPKVKIVIPGNDGLAWPDAEKVFGGEKISICNGELNAKVLYTPCHTKGHVQYFIEDVNPVLFSGDCFFLGGCGRFFEGTGKDMVEAVLRLKELPENTKMYCGHEYSQSNLEFALSVEPKNKSLMEKYEWVKKRREQNLPTIPSTLKEEFSYNPFLRVDQTTIQDYAKSNDLSAVMDYIRGKKDHF